MRALLIWCATMPWNDELFRAAIDKAARRQGKTISGALKEAGLSSGTITHPPENGRRIDIFERLMPVLEWSPDYVLRLIAECMGWENASALSTPGEVHIVLRNVDIRVTTSGSAVTGTTQSVRQ
jgi:hypothetical protein